MTSTETELDLLENIHLATAPPHQRDLARAIGLSLGMTNAILKRMARKGWLTIRKVNNRNIQYIVSSDGMEAIARRSYAYLRRTIGNVARYREVIERLVQDAATRGVREVVLVGASDLEFIVEHACGRAGVGLRRVEDDADVQCTEASLVVLSERLHGARVVTANTVALCDVLAAPQPAR